MDERWITIIHTLYHENQPMNIEELANVLNCSYNTIKSTISRNNESSKRYGFEIIESNDLSLNILDENRFHFFLSYSNDHDSRINDIIVHLLSTNDYVKIEDLAKLLFVSRGTIDRLIPEIKEIVHKYKLKLVSRAKFGIMIQGQEIDKRLCMAQYQSINDMDCLFEEMASHVILRIQQLISEAIEYNDFFIEDINYYNLVQHCIIMVHRIRIGNEITEDPGGSFVEMQKELNVSDQICNGFEKHFQIKVNECERKYVAIHLCGKRTLSQGEVIKSEIFETIREIFDEIKNTKGIDFNQDIELMTALALHIQPLVSRMKFGLTQQNPMTYKIKREMNRGFDLALCANEILFDRYHVRVNEAEAAYLALHFSLALERLSQSVEKKKVLVVCATGKGTARLIQYRLMSTFNYREEDIILTSLMHLDRYDYSNIECILTTIPIDRKYPVPILSIDLMMSDTSVRKLDSYFNKLSGIEKLEKIIKEELLFSNCNFENKKQVLQFICDQIKKIYHIDLYEEVLKREELSSTEVGNQIACPHPYQYQGDQLICSVVSLEKPIKWKFGNVQLILFLCYPVNDVISDQINQIFTELLIMGSELKLLIEDCSKENLIEILKGDNS